MLKELYIENLAIIEKAVISFENGLNIFSGETGAGKSILIGGINAVLGGRVSKDIVRSGTSKAVISALFDYIPENVSAKLEEYGYSFEDELLLQREISADGKSTARIGGKTATVAVLKDIASGIIDIHGQHDNQTLTSVEKQREILDSYGNISEPLNDYRNTFKAFSSLSRKIRQIQSDEQTRQIRIDNLTAKIEDVSSFQFSRGEEKEIAERLSEIQNIEEIRSNVSQAFTMLNGFETEQGAVDMVQRASDCLGKVAKYVKNGQELKERLDVAVIELNDIKSEVSDFLPEESSENLLKTLEERMSDILRVKRRYNKDIDDILDDLDQWNLQLEELQDSDDILEKLLQQKKELAEKLKQQGNKISELRKSTAIELENLITEQLIYLDMPNVKLIFDITSDKVTINGMDNVEMLISVNKGEAPKQLGKIASGGELSRIMLAIKNVLAQNDNIPTMIFDEIDVGISGRAAQKVGVKLHEISEKRQVLCVTHLAQIAAMADNHLLIEKNSDENRTYTHIKQLSFDDRKREIARIISGDPDNDISLKNAEELLKRKTDI